MKYNNYKSRNKMFILNPPFLRSLRPQLIKYYNSNIIQNKKQFGVNNSNKNILPSIINQQLFNQYIKQFVQTPDKIKKNTQQNSTHKQIISSLIIKNYRHNHHLTQNQEQTKQTNIKINKKQIYSYKKNGSRIFSSLKNLQKNKEKNSSYRNLKVDSSGSLKQLRDLLKSEGLVKMRKAAQKKQQEKDSSFRKRFYQNINKQCQVNQQANRQKSNTIQYQQIKKYYEDKYNKKKMNNQNSSQ